MGPNLAQKATIPKGVTPLPLITPDGALSAKIFPRPAAPKNWRPATATRQKNRGKNSRKKFAGGLPPEGGGKPKRPVATQRRAALPRIALAIGRCPQGFLLGIRCRDTVRRPVLWVLLGRWSLKRLHFVSPRAVRGSH